MKLLVMAAAAGMALSLGACGGHDGPRASRSAADSADSDLRTLARLDCPRREGDLRLASASADGRSCSYRTDRGGEVELRLTDLDGRTPAELLTPLEAELRTLVPAPVRVADKARAWGAEDEGHDSRVRLPGLSIDTRGDEAHIRIAGLTIDADDGSARINVADGKDRVLVNADDGRAEVRISENEGSDLRSSYILAQDEPAASGWRAVGYEVRGPRDGPLVLATMRARSDHDDAFEDAKDLLDELVGR